MIISSLHWLLFFLISLVSATETLSPLHNTHLNQTLQPEARPVLKKRPRATNRAVSQRSTKKDAIIARTGTAAMRENDTADFGLGNKDPKKVYNRQLKHLRYTHSQNSTTVSGTWTKEENRLMRMTIESAREKGEYPTWTDLSRQLNRSHHSISSHYRYYFCEEKRRRIMAPSTKSLPEFASSRMKALTDTKYARFSPEDDALIMDMIEDSVRLNSKRQWIDIGLKLNRTTVSLGKRCQRILSCIQSSRTAHVPPSLSASECEALDDECMLLDESRGGNDVFENVPQDLSTQDVDIDKLVMMLDWGENDSMFNDADFDAAGEFISWT